MKKLLYILTLLPLLALGQVNIRPITQVNDVNRIADDYYNKQITWFQGDSIRFDVFARDGKNALDLTGQSFPVMFVTAETNRQIVYIAKTGTVVSATNGHVRAELPADGATLPTNLTYSTWMILFRATGGVTTEVATVAYSHTRVFPSPLGVTYTNVGQITNWSIDVSGIVSEQDPLFFGWLATNTYIKSESDPAWSAASNTIHDRIAAVETGSVALTTYSAGTQAIYSAIASVQAQATNEVDPVWSAASGTVFAALANAATGSVIYVEADPVWNSVSGAVFTALANAATGTPIYSLSGYVTGDVVRAEADPVWMSERETIYASLSGKATGTPLYVESDPVWESVSNIVFAALANAATGTPIYSLAGYATGTPVYVEVDPIWTAASGAVWSAIDDALAGNVSYQETDPIWTAAASNYYTKSQAGALFSTGSPLYEVDLTPYATGSPIYVETPEADPIWSAASGTVFAAIADKESRYALQTVPSTNWILLATNVLVDNSFTSATYAATGGVFAIKTESDLQDGSVVAYIVCGDSYPVPGSNSTIKVLSACTSITLSREFLPSFEEQSNTISAIYYQPWIYLADVGSTNDLRGTTVRIAEAVLTDSPVTKDYTDRAIAAIRVDQWSGSPAVTAVDFNGNEVLFGDGFAAQSDTNAFAFTYDGSPFMRFLAGTGTAPTNGTASIVSASITATQFILGVVVSPGWIPTPQYSFDAISWTNVNSWTSTTQAYGVINLTFVNSLTNDTVLLRVTVTNDASYDLESTMEITADNLLLLGRRMVINDAEGNGVVTLSATGGLKVGTASFTADAAGNIAQDSTNSAALGQVSIDRITSNVKIGPIPNAAPGYSRQILWESGSLTNYLSTYYGSLFFYDPADTNRLLGWRTRVVTEGSLAAGLTNSGIKIGANSFELDANGTLAANWNLGGYTISNGVVAGYVSISNLTEILADYATGTVVAVEADPIWEDEKTNYYTIAEAEALFVQGDPVFIEQDPLWSAVSNQVMEAISNVSTGSPLYEELDPLFAAAEPDLITTGTLATALSDYATTASLAGYVATNGSASGLVGFPASVLQVSTGNSNYWRITTAPASNASFGQRGQIAVSSSNVFIYNPDALGTGTGRWIRVSGDISW